MANKSDKKKRLDAVMARLRVSYMQELPDRVASLEELVLKLEQGDLFVEVYQQLFREVHSMKGGGGTYGFSVITTICHHMEDLLKVVGESQANLTQDIVDTLLRYIDLIRQAPDCYHTGDNNLEKIETALNSLHNSMQRTGRRCLIVEGSVTTQQLISLALDDQPSEITQTDNGMEALERLLHEEFDLLITGLAIGNINGKALIAAIRLSDSVNANIPAILLTTSESIPDPVSTAADIILKKGPEMPENLIKACKQLL